MKIYESQANISISKNFEKYNSEKISAKLLNMITRNTGFETDKSKVGPCFITECCEWENRQADDICGLDNKRLSISEKMVKSYDN